MPHVAITQNEDIALALSEALSHLDLEQSIRGRIVAIKPNDTWASAQDAIRSFTRRAHGHELTFQHA